MNKVINNARVTELDGVGAAVAAIRTAQDSFIAANDAYIPQAEAKVRVRRALKSRCLPSSMTSWCRILPQCKFLPMRTAPHSLLLWRQKLPA